MENTKVRIICLFTETTSWKKFKLLQFFLEKQLFIKIHIINSISFHEITIVEAELLCTF